MKDISINISIGGKDYPLQISEEQKNVVEQAAHKINETFSQLSEKYAVKDSRDLMAMSALWVVSELLEKGGETESSNNIHLLEEVNAELESLIN